MKLLPNTDQHWLRAAVIGLCIFYLISAAAYLRVARENWFYGAIAVGLFIPLSIGLWRLMNIARIVALVIHWILFVLIPLTLLSPFAEMDGLYGQPPIPLWAILSLVMLIGGLNCCAIYALSKFKDQFRPLGYAN